MIASGLWVCAIGLLAAFPGWLVARDCDRPGLSAAWITVSFTLSLLLTALAGSLVSALGLGNLPAATVIPMSLLLALAAFRYRSAGRTAVGEWQGWLFAAAFTAIGLASFAAATAIAPDGTLIVHSWYNADGFKHLGHVHALANWGVPARDIFGNGGPLYYYWLSYIVPGAAASLGGDAVAAALVWNALLASLFGLLLFGVLRASGARPSIALATAALAIFVTAPSGYALSILGGTTIADLLAVPYAPKGPALLPLTQFVPQHSLAASLLLAIVLIELDEQRPAALRWIARCSFAAILTVSTLLGAMLMLAYGLHRLWLERQRAILPLAAIGGLAAVFVLVLHVVLLGRPTAAIESPLFTNSLPDVGPAGLMMAAAKDLLGNSGLPFLVAVYFLVRGRFAEPAAASLRALGLSLLIAAFVACLASAVLLPARITIELVIRASILIGLAVAIAGGSVLEQAWRSGRAKRLIALGAAAALALVALPGVYVRLAWLGKYDRSEYTTRLSPDDRAALAYLRDHSSVEARVWQFPEPPVLALQPGGDAWAPIFAGRMVPNSQRATDFAAAAPFIERSASYFAGQPAAVPQDMEWVYLSRALHPASFDRLVMRLSADPGWRQRACYRDACLFSRLSASEQ